MRTGGRAGGGSFKIPSKKGGGKSYDPFEVDLGFLGDLPVTPALEPINDDWSFSNFNENVDPRDCSRYPASPYCGGSPFRLGAPFGYDFELRTNGCETCLYIYPVIAWTKLTPQIICYRRPDCLPDINPKPISVGDSPFPQFPEEVPSRWVSPACATLRNVIIRRMNAFNTGAAINDRRTTENFLNQADLENAWIEDLGTFPAIGGGPGQFVTTEIPFTQIKSSTRLWKITGETTSIVGYSWITGVIFPACKNAQSPPPQPPPPSNDVSDKEKERKDDMCCNECKDAAEKTDKMLKQADKLLQEIKSIKKTLGSGKLELALDAAVGIGDSSLTALLNNLSARLGTSRYPIEVPASLLTGVGDEVLKVQSLTDFQYWLVNQIDALVGEFPIKIKVQDIDPLTPGDQSQNIEIPNIAEAIAEMYGLTIKNSINQEVELNMLVRLAAEVIATKNGVAVTQDYARANASFLGYRGNPTARELTYNFDFASVDLSGENFDILQDIASSAQTAFNLFVKGQGGQNVEPIVLESLLNTVKGNVQGWKNDDKETLVDYLKRLMFAAGIMKAAFFRNKKQVEETAQGVKDMFGNNKEDDKAWDEFLQAIRDPNSQYNKDYDEKPEIKRSYINPNEL
ncbi:hypothetical protein [Pseudanabaena sp. 'Roaring Creek']|uniref:hypothetical protein n=1 Tax=Pseudanabaena sp. 'Roaring Creek' TaxID=1681830 RepID=UPI0006D792C9|nr:hypothetical protein [Pseudanabaena sp. 'Roaring Creek']